MTILRLLCALGLAGGVCLLAQCRAHDSSTSTFPRSETLYIGGLQWGEPVSFNPLLSSPAWPVPNGDQTFNLLYEPLFSYNSETGKMAPLLGESYTVTEDAITVTLNPAGRWSDGTPVTGLDVKYTFELGKRYKSLRVGPRWAYIEEIRVEDDAAVDGGPTDHKTRVAFVLAKGRRNQLSVLDALQETAILPRHVIEPLLEQAHGDLDEFTKLKFYNNPVVSGPYHVLCYSSEKIVLERDDNYWGNTALHGGARAAPKYIIDPIYKNNDNYSLALQQGRLDASICFMPRIWLKQEKRRPQLVRQRAFLRLRVHPDAGSQRDTPAVERRGDAARNGVRHQLPRHPRARGLRIQRAAQAGAHLAVRARENVLLGG